MDITLLYFDSCPSWKTVAQRLATITAERADIAVTHHLVESIEDAERLEFHGSPSILVNGEDVFADADAPVGLSCRVYQTPAGPAGAPTIEQLQAVLPPA
ncbi:thioredoxin family protein [Cumulibacter manganitolerans]|uniref:thioredoxin family protein n=1 Tax=Cumulibacter manganitolerans TaxID=1884992 RepID=UPI0012957F83|nr:thioredoxin family protein [Cumulibacter manganitolerans]